jgi:hypothetical protein
MKRFLLLYNGPPTPPQSSHEGWPEWFERIGDALVDRGSPMVNGVALHGDGSTSRRTSSLNGYSVIQAADSEDALELIADHPFVQLGSEYTIEAFELPAK